MLLFKYRSLILFPELQYPFIRVLECKFNLAGSLQVNKELITRRIKINIVFNYNKKTQNSISKNIGTILIIK